MSKSTRQCAYAPCGKTFIPNNGKHRYCAAACEHKAWCQRNPDKHKANRRKEEAKRRQNNPEKVRQIRQRCYWSNPKHARALGRASWQRQAAKRRAGVANGETSV